jgi:hypothetical protein
MDTNKPSNPQSFSVYWASVNNMNGTNPPNPQFQIKQSPPYVQVSTVLPSPYENIAFPVGTIQSNREPYSILHMYNSYGSLNTKLGTNLGS